jgi:uncharacterized protein (DUF362 family)
MEQKAEHPVYSKDAAVYLETGENKIETMKRAMDRSGFLANVARELEKSGKTKAEFLIAIKPNIMTASVPEKESPVYTDPKLVKHLIDQLREEGYGNIAVVEARNVYDYAYQGRYVKSVAKMAGYTSEGYRIEDLSEREQQEAFDYGGVLGDHFVGRTWRDADYRISFAKNKTHFQCYYTACLKNIYGCLPQWDKMKVYHGKGREFAQCCVLILDHFPVHFGFMDAWVSGDGFSGHIRDANPNHTKTIFASENVFALDWVAGEKMKVKPQKNAIIKEAMKRWHTPEITRHGDMTPWKPWSNVWGISIKILDLTEEIYFISRFFSRCFAAYQDKRFPPVKRGQWFYGSVQAVVRSVEWIFSPKRRGRKKR